MRLRVRVPATSANLGPGFDCFGLALDLCNEVTLDTSGEPSVEWEGEGADELPIDGTDRISLAMRAIAAAAGREVPPASMRALNRIPLERGLGSSAAAAIAGALLGDRLLGLQLGTDDLLSSVLGIEGHPDNVAAALLGGFTIAFQPDGVIRLDPEPSLRPVLLVPNERSSTEVARRALPDVVPMADAVHNLSRSALAVLALTQEPELLSVALEDRLHQDRRLSGLPAIRAVFDRLRSDGIPVCVSGAGPTLLAFERDQRVVADPGPGWRVLRPGVRASGAEVEVLAG